MAFATWARAFSVGSSAGGTGAWGAFGGEGNASGTTTTPDGIGAGVTKAWGARVTFGFFSFSSDRIGARLCIATTTAQVPARHIRIRRTGTSSDPIFGRGLAMFDGPPLPQPP